jgi:hypothetical protein
MPDNVQPENVQPRQVNRSDTADRHAAQAFALRRARRRFWLLLVMAALAAGALSSALAAPSGPLTGLRVATSGLVLLVSLTLAARVMIAVERARRRARDPRR